MATPITYILRRTLFKINHCVVALSVTLLGAWTLTNNTVAQTPEIPTAKEGPEISSLTVKDANPQGVCDALLKALPADSPIKSVKLAGELPEGFNARKWTFTLGDCTLEQALGVIRAMTNLNAQHGEDFIALSYAYAPKELIPLLGADKFADRRHARENLLHIGPAVLPFVQKAITDEDPEIRNQARKLATSLLDETSSEYLEESAAKIRFVYQETYKSEIPPQVFRDAVKAFNDEAKHAAVNVGKDLAKAQLTADEVEQATVAGDGTRVLELLNSSNAERRTKWLGTLGKADCKTFTTPRAGTPAPAKRIIKVGVRNFADAVAKVAGENVEIHLEKGHYKLGDRTFKETIPTGLTFVGKGKDNTTLLMSDHDLGEGSVDRLCFRDLTIDCDNDGWLDKRGGGSVTLHFDNVRLVRFDAGHGGCDSLSVRGGVVIYAKNSDFLGGFGRAPGCGQIFESNLTVGHFEDCAFFGLRYEIFQNAGHQLWMERCKFEKRWGVDPRSKVEFIDCDFGAKAPAIKWKPAE